MSMNQRIRAQAVGEMNGQLMKNTPDTMCCNKRILKLIVLGRQIKSLVSQRHRFLGGEIPCQPMINHRLSLGSGYGARMLKILNRDKRQGIDPNWVFDVSRADGCYGFEVVG